MNREAPWAMSRDDAAYLLSHLVESAAENDPTHIAMVSRKRQLSCGEMHSRSNALARLLSGSGVRKGDRVGISLNKKHADGEGTRFFQGRRTVRSSHGDTGSSSTRSRPSCAAISRGRVRVVGHRFPGDTETRALGDPGPRHPARRARHTLVHGPVSSLVRQAVRDRSDGELSSHDHRKDRSQEAGGPGSRVNEED